MAAFVIKVYTDNDEAIPSASVGIFDMNGTPIMSTVSDVDGFALFVTDENQVRVRASLYDYSFPENVVLSPEDGHVYNLYASLNEVAPPLDAHVCRVHGQVRDPLGGELPDRWKMKVIRVGTVGDAHSYDIVSGVAGINHLRGQVTLDLVRGSSYRIGPLPITRYGDTDYEDMSYVDINIPQRPTARLVDLVAPCASSVEADDTISVTVGTAHQVELSTTLSDGTTADKSNVYLVASVESLNIQTAIVGNVLSITCLASGTYTVKLNAYIDASQLNGAFYRPCAEKTLHEIEVECGP